MCFHHCGSHVILSLYMEHVASRMNVEGLIIISTPPRTRRLFEKIRYFQTRFPTHALNLRFTFKVTFEWSVEQSQFVLTFGYCGPNLSANPQCFTSRLLQQEFNNHQNLPYIVQVLPEFQMIFQKLSRCTVKF